MLVSLIHKYNISLTKTVISITLDDDFINLLELKKMNER